jgi:hypothetical protein
MTTEEFCPKLDTFFSQVPKDFKYAVEIRNAGLLESGYRNVLEAYDVAHVYNHWSYMPPLAEQHKRTFFVMGPSFNHPEKVRAPELSHLHRGIGLG